MKKIIGIVSEYNPFHAGHARHIRESRKMLGEDCLVVACMSGDFVQRGEWAIRPKRSRAEEACRGGADVVIELPLPWCLSSAQRFAEGAVGILASLGITHLSFGSETGDLASLLKAAQTLSAPGFEEEVKAILRTNPAMSYPAARSIASGEAVLGQPNDLLAVEYLMALRGKPIEPMAVKRAGSGHDAPGDGDFPSASELRRRIRQGQLQEEHVSDEILSLAALSRLRMLEKQVFCELPDCGTGLGNRIYEAVRNSVTLQEIFDAAKTRRYTHSRVRRCVMCAVLGVRREDNAVLPPYARLLAANENGRAFLAEKRDECSIPLVTQPKAVSKLGERAERVFALGASAHDYYLLGYPYAASQKCGQDYRTGPFLV